MIIIAEPPVAPAAAPAAAATVPVVATPAPPPPAAPQMDAEVSLGAIVAAALGPLPQVCPEHVLLDLERARMTAEDLRVAAISPYYTYAAPRGPRRRLMPWREFGTERNEMTSTLSDQMGRAADLIEEARAGALRAADSNGSRADFRVALIGTNNLLVDAGRALNDEGSESEEISDEEMSDGETSDEEEMGDT